MRRITQAAIVAAVVGVGIAAFLLWKGSPQTAKSFIRELNAQGIDCRLIRSGVSQPQFSYDHDRCSVQGEILSIITFSRSSAREAYDEQAEDVGQYVIRGPDWRVTVSDAELADRLARLMDGTLSAP
jgi:hypothetical protein